MNGRFRTAMMTALCLFFGAASAPAQDIGVILEWINKMSGPPFGGVGAAFTVPIAGREDPEPHFRYRAEAVFFFSYSEEGEVDPDDASIRLFTFRNTLVMPVRYIPLDVNVGVSLHRFSGSDFDSFWHWSIPIQAQLRIDKWDPVTVRLGPSVDVFHAFDQDDFLPLDVDVSRNDNEAVYGFLVGVDFPLF